MVRSLGRLLSAGRQCQVRTVLREPPLCLRQCHLEAQEAVQVQDAFRVRLTYLDRQSETADL